MASADQIPHQVPSNGATQQQQSPQQSPQQPQIASTIAAPAQTGAIDTLQCQWSGCGERAANPEQLYEHVCERHVGRKSTNNLNLTCQWGNCRTTTVKRDHITSHIRVHVPLKPHKCDFCGKSFKRPQDLKKHVKTHADDSVILRSPEPVGANRHHQNGGYSMGNGSQQRTPGFYGDNPLQSNVPLGYNYQNHNGPQGYYAPTQQPSSSAYGPVYYNVSNGAEVSHNASFDNRKRGYEALNDFFGDAKRRSFDPNSYSDVGNRLLAFQGLQLPALTGGGSMAEYQSAPAMVSSYGGGGVYGPTASHGYALPPMPNLRTKNDLTTVDQILEQMTATAYESPSFVAAAGVAQPGAVHVQTGMGHRPRQSNSPPSIQLPSAHNCAHSSQSISMQSNHSGTPDLTPGSSTMSYTSGHSPVSAASNNGMSPLHSASMYPSLPSTTRANMSGEYIPSLSSMAPASTLGTQFDHDHRRRHSGGTLQKAQPAMRREMIKQEDEMDTAEDGEDNAPTPKMKALSTADSDCGSDDIFSSEHKQPRSDANVKATKQMIDPALSGLASPLSSPERDNGLADRADEMWVENIRMLEALREFVREKLERGEYEGGAAETREEVGEKKEGGMSMHEDGEVEGEGNGDGDGDGDGDGMSGLYPVLRAVESG